MEPKTSSRAEIMHLYGVVHRQRQLIHVTYSIKLDATTMKQGRVEVHVDAL